MILKIQLPIATNAVFPLALAYNEDRNVSFHLPINGPLQARMNGRAKAFFAVALDSSEVEIGDEVPDPGW